VRDREIQESQKRGGRGPSWAVTPEKRNYNYRHIIKADTASFKSYNHSVHVMTSVIQARGVTASAMSLHKYISIVPNSNLLTQELHVRAHCRAVT